MNTRYLTRMIALLLAVASLVPAAEPMAQAQAAAPQAIATPEPVIAVHLDGRYAAYGFLFEQYEGHDRFSRFTEHQLQVLGEVIEAYADLAGGPASLKALVNGPVRVRRDEGGVVSYTQAGKVIGIGRGAFDLALTEQSNYYNWGARSGDELAQIVFGHEIGHRWIDALRRRGGRDWGVAYGQNVSRDERLSSREVWPAQDEVDGVSPEEEAVTNLALYVMDNGYRWTFLHDAPATEGRQLWIDGWVSDLVNSSR